MRQAGFPILLFVVTVLLAACGGIRYSQLHPEETGFHPKTVVLLPVDVRTSYEATDMADEVFTRALQKSGRFGKVVSPAEIRERMGKDPAFSKEVTDYVTKFRAVSFSDPVLTQALEDRLETEAILLVTVDYWYYTVEGEDKIAKVGFAVDLVNASTGRIAWKAAHHEQKTYWLIKPALPDLAESVAGTIIGEMPR